MTLPGYDDELRPGEFATLSDFDLAVLWLEDYCRYHDYRYYEL